MFKTGVLLLALMGLSQTGFASVHSSIDHLISNGKYDEALSQVDARLKGSRDDIALQTLRADILVGLNRNEEALKVYQSLIEKNPQQPELYNNLALLQARQGNYEAARHTLEQGLNTSRIYSTIYENLSNVYMEMARDSYGKALQLGTDLPRLSLKRLLIQSPKPEVRVAANQATSGTPVTEAEKSPVPDNSQASSELLVAQADNPKQNNSEVADTTDEVVNEEVPATTEELKTDEVPVTTEELKTDEAPVTTEELKTDEAPVTTEELKTDEAPVTTEELKTDEAPVTTEELKTDEAPVTTEDLKTSDDPVTDEEPKTIEEPVKKEEPVSKEDPGTTETEEKGVKDTLFDWASAWSSQRLDHYLSYYADEFKPPRGQSRKDWQQERQQRLAKPEWIKVELSEMNVEYRDAQKATVTLVQAFQSNRYADKTRKKIRLIREENRWRIVKEISLGIIN